MRQRFIIILILAVLAVLLLPGAALAYNSGDVVYNDNDYIKLRDSLNGLSADGIHTNGWQINPEYDPQDPTTWADVGWTGPDTDRRVQGIDWEIKSLAGLLDLSGFTNLQAVYCGFNNLSGLNVTGDAALELVTCPKNAIGSLNVSSNPLLRKLYCDNNNIEALDVSANPELDYLSCASNRLPALDISANPKLQSVSCGRNALVTLDASGHAALQVLCCDENHIKSLDITGCAQLSLLDCAVNELKTLDLSGSPGLKQLGCEDNEFESLDMSGLHQLTELICSRIPAETLDMSANTALQYLVCEEMGIKKLELGANPSLTYLDCSGNELRELDMGANPSLAIFDCSDNSLEMLKVDGNKKLMNMDCRNNKLKSLNTGENVFYLRFDSRGNPLKSLDTIVRSSAIRLRTIGEGYAGLYYDTTTKNEFYAQADASSGAVFIDWTQSGGAPVTSEAKYDLTVGGAYELTANFLSLEAEPANGKIYTGEHITLTPSIAGGEWSFNETLLSRSGNVFTGLKQGTAAATYTLGSKQVGFDVTVVQALTLTRLPADGRIYTGGRITITPSIEGGTWSFDASYLSRDGNTFTGLKAGTVRVTYNAREQSAYTDITVLQSQIPKTGQDGTWIWMLGGAGLTALAGAFATKKAFNK